MAYGYGYMGFVIGRRIPGRAASGPSVPSGFTLGQIAPWTVPTTAGDRFWFAVYQAPSPGSSSILQLEWQLNSGSGYGATQSAAWTGLGYYEVPVLPDTSTIARVRVTSAIGPGPWLVLEPVVGERYQELVLTSSLVGGRLYFQWSGSELGELTTSQSAGRRYFQWSYADEDAFPLIEAPVSPPVTGEVIPEGLITTTSPASLLAFIGYEPADEIRANVRNEVPGELIYYGYDVSGNLILHGQPGVRDVVIDSFDPPCFITSQRVRTVKDGALGPGPIHGAMRDLGRTRSKPNSPNEQGFDPHRSKEFAGSNHTTYNDALNVDPGNTGIPLSFVGGQEASIIKARSLTTIDDGGGPTALTRSLAVVTITNSLPTPGLGRPFRPPQGAISKNFPYHYGDIDWAAFPTLVPVAGGPDPATLLARVRVAHMVEMAQAPSNRRYSAQIGTSGYGANRAEDWANSAIFGLSAGDQDTRRAHLAMMCQIGLDVADVLDRGGRFNINKGLGGLMAGPKLPLIIAAIAFDDQRLIDWAQRLDWSAEDRQHFYVTPEMVSAYDYGPGDLGMAEWGMNPIAFKRNISRILSGATATGGQNKTYRQVNMKWQLPVTMAMRLIPGAREMWNNQALFDYCDRLYNNNTVYFDGAAPVKLDGTSLGGAFNWGLTHNLIGQDNSASQFAINFHAAYRNNPGTGARWTWS